MGLIQSSEDHVFAANIKTIARSLGTNKDIDWEQRRYEIAKDCLAAEMANHCHNYQAPTQNVLDAVQYADILIEVLRKKVSSIEDNSDTPVTK